MNIVGPVLFYDMMRTGRRWRYILLRCLYAAALLGLMYPIYHGFFVAPVAVYSPTGGLTFVPPQVTGQTMAEFSEQFFAYFVVAQLLAILLATPAYVAGAIAEEKQRQTLEYLLTTDLTAREIVLDKFVSRLANLALFLVAGLPVLSATLLFGGVSPILLWCGFAATASAMLSVSALSILQSVLARRVRDALMRCYLLLLGYFACWGLVWMLRHFFALDKHTPPEVFTAIDTFLEYYNAGNPVAALNDLVTHVKRYGNLGAKPLQLLGWFALFHGVVTVTCLALAVFRLRAVYVRQAFGQAAPRPKKARGERPPSVLYRPVIGRPRGVKPPLGAHPMIWKERYCEPGLRLGVLGELAFVVLALAVLLPAVITAGAAIANYVLTGNANPESQRFLNEYTRWVGTGVAVVLLLSVGVRAAGALGAEANRLTLDTLLTTRLTNREILGAKWWVSATGSRWTLALVLLLWGVCSLVLAVHPLGLLTMMVALAVFLAFMASLGLVAAMRAGTGGRAGAWTALILFVLSATPFFFQDARGRAPAALLLSPPRILYGCAFDLRDVQRFWNNRAPESYLEHVTGRRNPTVAATREEVWMPVLLPVVGLMGYAAAALVLWRWALVEFGRRHPREQVRATGPPPKERPVRGLARE